MICLLGSIGCQRDDLHYTVVDGRRVPVMDTNYYQQRAREISASNGEWQILADAKEENGQIIVMFRNPNKGGGRRFTINASDSARNDFLGLRANEWVKWRLRKSDPKVLSPVLGSGMFLYPERIPTAPK